MRTVSVDRLEPGMVLAQDIQRGDGIMLARSGTELSPGVIAMIRRMVELEAVAIEGSPFSSPEEARAWRDDQLRALLRRFSKVEGDPFMERLKKLEARRIVDSSKWEDPSPAQDKDTADRS